MKVTNPCRALVPVLLFVLAACSTPTSVQPTAALDLLPTSAPVTAAIPEATTAEVVDEVTAVPAAIEPATTEPATTEPATTEPATTEPATTEPAITVPEPSFAPVTYTDESAGFALDYPAEWTLSPESQVGVRGGQALLLSPDTSAESMPEGGTRISITTYVWDPKNDLDAWLAQRKVAWDASGFAITREEEWQLADERTVHALELLTPETPTFTLLTTAGDDYLQISGEGDLALAEEVMRTLRSLD